MSSNWFDFCPPLPTRPSCRRSSEIASAPKPVWSDHPWQYNVQISMWGLWQAGPSISILLPIFSFPTSRPSYTQQLAISYICPRLFCLRILVPVFLAKKSLLFIPAYAGPSKPYLYVPLLLSCPQLPCLKSSLLFQNTVFTPHMHHFHSEIKARRQIYSCRSQRPLCTAGIQ